MAPAMTEHFYQYLYQHLEQDFREEIRSGQRLAGERLPSVRELCANKGISKSTVLTAYRRLEADGLVEARPRSGYFVCNHPAARPTLLKTPEPDESQLAPAPVSAAQVLVDIMEKGAAFDLLPSHEQTPGNELLRRCLSRAMRRQSSEQQLYYDEPMGLLPLREQLAQRIMQEGKAIEADKLLITGGCQHALLLALMATTEPGDVVAIESPGFYGAFQLLEALGLQALELPGSAENGISPEALALALQHWDVKALMLSPSFATPTGARMPDDNKQRILELTQPKGIAIIEDDIYGDLHFGLQRPRTLFSYDKSGSVLLCSSFSKSLSRDLRFGWIAPGKYRDKVKRLKIVTSLATSTTLQQGVSAFLEEGGLDHHLRQKRLQLQQQCAQLQTLIPNHLPMAVSASQPKGGLVLWLELPKKIDTLALYAKAREQGIVITPGSLFSGQERYKNFLRLSFAHPLTAQRIDALALLGRIIEAFD